MLIFAYIAMKVSFLMHNIWHIKVGKTGELQCNHFTNGLKTYEDTMTILFYNIKIKGHCDTDYLYLFL